MLLHNLPLNVVKHHLKRLLDEGLIQPSDLEQRVRQMPWTAGKALYIPLASKLSPILLCMCKYMSNNEALLSHGPYIADHSIAQKKVMCCLHMFKCANTAQSVLNACSSTFVCYISTGIQHRCLQLEVHFLSSKTAHCKQHIAMCSF